MNIKKSLYAHYILERENAYVLETEEGFGTYKFLNDKVCYLMDIFILKEHRKTNKATEIANKIKEIAKKEGSEILLGSVCTDANKVTESIKVLLAYGMEFYRSEGNMIYFRMEIK